MLLLANTLLEWIEDDTLAEAADETPRNPRVLRVLWTNPLNQSAAVINLYDNSGKPERGGKFDNGAAPEIRTVDELAQAVTDGQMRVLRHDPSLGLVQRREEEIKPKHRIHRDHSFAAIQPMLEKVGLPKLFDPVIRRAAIVKAAADTGLTEVILRRYLRRYWQGGQTVNALLPHFDHCGAKGVSKSKPGGKKRGRPRKVDQEGREPAGINLGPEDHEKFRLGIKTFYLKQEGKGCSLEAAFEKTLSRYYHVGHKRIGAKLVPVLPLAEHLPSFGQFIAFFYKHRNATEVLLSRHGRRKFNLRHRAVLGTSDKLGRFGPGSCFQIDSTTADVYLVSSLDRSRLIGRPTLYLIVDVFSRLIVGFAVTLESPSYAAAMLALENAATDKVVYCRQYGISICEEEWPSAHLCDTLLADRGELASQLPNHLVRALKMTLAATAPYRPDWKAIVETRFKLTNDGVVRWLPGAVHPWRERGDCDHALDATLTLNEFRQVMIHFILLHNRERIEGYNLDKFQIADQVEPRPYKLWQYGITHRSGGLHTLDQESLRLLLFLPVQATVTYRGIKINNSLYTCPTADAQGWFVRARESGTWKVDVFFHPHHRQIAYWRPGPDLGLEACTLLSPEDRFRDCDIEEVDDYFLRVNEAKAGKLTVDRQARLDSHAQIDAIKESAKKLTGMALVEAGSQSKSARRSGLRDARAQEKEHERSLRQEQFTEGNAPGETSQDGKIVSFTPVPAPSVVDTPGTFGTAASATMPTTPGYIASASFMDSLKESRRKRQKPNP